MISLEPAAIRSGSEPVRRGAGLLLSLLFASFGIATPLAAQVDPSGMLAENLKVTGKGWGQLTDLQEMGQFLLGLIEVTAMTAVIAYHPATRTDRRKLAEYQVPGTLFVYALIGMVVGFLVMNHGAIIGFVIFGIGGLLRFRTDVDKMSDTMRLILVTLVGLCVGLDLPVMALITTASAWAIVYVFGASPHHVVEVKFADKHGTPQAREDLETGLRSAGFSIAGLSKAKAKHTFSFTVVGGRSGTRDILVQAMMELDAANPDLMSDWHLA
ncbi:hypothetical protein SAMN04488026_108716 [Aliiruegeria lutimaris]|uniref:DUF4956 domain-containing protein n=1 Tax=Aliiruegeria lutimaris TaxID=571298 RepID=A0A1G9KBM4_9RHOB|nr:hypothetical protein SAMN04488026_108716 [Aliiruegeria lutimaris]